LISRYPNLCVFAYEYFVFLVRVANPSAKSQVLEDQFVCLSLASLLRPVRLGRPYQGQKIPAGIARKVIEARKPPHHDKVETAAGNDGNASMPERVKRSNPWRKMAVNTYFLIKPAVWFLELVC
jgi:hypothetical protein